MQIRVLVVDDHKILCEGLRALLEKQTNVKVVGEAENGRIAVQLTNKLVPDVVIMDVSMPDLNGIEATRQIIKKNPNIKVIALSMYNDRRFVMQMIKAGASGYLLKENASRELVQAICIVLEDKIYLSPDISCVLVNNYLANVPNNTSDICAILTAKEREVLQLLTEGGNTKEIAFSFKVSVKTIETHRQNIMSKLNIHSIAELTKYAIREGLTTL